MTTLILALIAACSFAIYHYRKKIEEKAAAEQAALRQSWGLMKAPAPPVQTVKVDPKAP